MAATIATYAAWLGLWADNYEPTAWVEDLIESACAVAHPRLGSLYLLASHCYNTGRIDDAVRYSDAGQKVIGNAIELPFDSEGLLGIAYCHCRANRTLGRVVPLPNRTWARHPHNHQGMPGVRLGDRRLR